LEAHGVFGVVYRNPRVLAFEQNYGLFWSRQYHGSSDEPAELTQGVKDFVRRLRSSETPLRIGIDVSSMDRSVMATVLVSTLACMKAGDAFVLLYASAEFVEPPLLLRPIRSIGAAHPAISGLVGDPRLRRALILGLGYEYGVALNVIETHDPDDSFIFRPLGADPRFLDVMKRANFDYDFGERKFEVIDYPLTNLSSLYDTLSGLVFSIKHDTSIVAVPLGPKIFSAISIVAAVLNAPNISVLRYSLYSLTTPSDVRASSAVDGIEFLVLPEVARNSTLSRR
jgi:hypothetical protein